MLPRRLLANPNTHEAFALFHQTLRALGLTCAAAWLRYARRSSTSWGY
jgi:hypothetical protein